MQKYFFFLFLISSFCWSQDKHEWHKDSLLTWKDFKGKPQNNMTDVAALSFCGLRFQSCEYEDGEQPTYKTTAYFQRSKSWSKEEHQYDDVLNHEQLHFDLAEIYARKIRAYFNKNTVSLSKSTEVYNQFYEEYLEIQNQYDEETHHGTKDKEQATWNEKVKKWLDELFEYEDNKCY